jgi:hypothetical protein
VGGGKQTEKRKGAVKILDTQGFGAFRFYSVFIPFSIPFFYFFGGGWEAVFETTTGACGPTFPFSSLIPPQAFFLPYTADCKVRHKGKLVGVRVRVCGHTFHTPFPYPSFCRRKLSAGGSPTTGLSYPTKWNVR